MLTSIIFNCILCIISSPFTFALPATEVIVDSLNYVYVPVYSDAIKFKVKTEGEVHVLLCADTTNVKTSYNIHLTNKYSLISRNEDILVNVSTSKIFMPASEDEFIDTTSTTTPSYRSSSRKFKRTSFSPDVKELVSSFQEFTIFRLKEDDVLAVSKGNEPYPFLLWNNADDLGEINYVGVSIVAPKSTGNRPSTYDGSELPSLMDLRLYDNNYGSISWMSWNDYVERHPSYKVYDSLAKALPKVTAGGQWIIESISADDFAMSEVGKHFNITCIRLSPNQHDVSVD